MKRIILILTVGILAGLFASCEDEHPGYLFSTEAKYAVDSLEVMTTATIKATLEEMRRALEDFDQTEMGKSIRKRQAELEAEVDKLEDEMSELAAKRDEILDYLKEQDKLPEEERDKLSKEERDRLNAQAEDYNNQFLEKKSARHPFWDEIELLDEQIENEIGSISKDIVPLQRQFDDHVPYSSAVIDQLKGTTPLIYSIAGIKASDGGDAGKFAPYLSVMGGGRFIVDWDENIPTGRYLISLYVENEGWRNLLSDIFTIIVK